MSCVTTRDILLVKIRFSLATVAKKLLFLVHFLRSIFTSPLGRRPLPTRLPPSDSPSSNGERAARGEA